MTITPASNRSSLALTLTLWIAGLLTVSCIGTVALALYYAHLPKWSKASVACGYYLQKDNEHMWILFGPKGFGAVPRDNAGNRREPVGVQYISVQGDAIVGLMTTIYERDCFYGFVVTCGGPSWQMQVLQSPEFGSKTDALAWLSSQGYDGDNLIFVETWARDNRLR